MAKRRVADDENSDVEDQGGRNDALLAKIDPEYLNQPIDLRQGDAKLKGLLVNLKQVSKQLEDVADTLAQVAEQMAEVLSESYRDDEYDEDKMLGVFQDDASISGLDGEFRSTLDRLAETRIRMDIVSDIRTRIVGGHQISDINKLYEQKAYEPLAAYRAKSARQKFIKHRAYKGFVDMVWESLTSGAGVPNMKRFLPREDADEDDSDDELEIGAQQQTFQCPITLTDFEDPYTSTVCPHSFSGPAIKDLLKQAHNSVHCPVAGCNKTLTPQLLERDDALRRRVEAHQKRVKEGRTQATQGGGRTYETMDLSDEDE
ncbi:hypothetical protein JCM8097_004367 [Rhodosporidiobolus ruineniae]